MLMLDLRQLQQHPTLHREVFADVPEYRSRHTLVGMV